MEWNLLAQSTQYDLTISLGDATLTNPSCIDMFFCRCCGKQTDKCKIHGCDCRW